MDSIVDKILNQEEKAQELRKQNVIVLHDFKFDTNKEMIAETLNTIYKKEKEHTEVKWVDHQRRKQRKIKND